MADPSFPTNPRNHLGPPIQLTRSVNMPRQTAPQNGPQLSVNIIEREFFYHGDTILGEISRQTPIADQEATLSIELRGSVAVQISQATNQSRRYYKQHINLWEPASQEVHRGPVHVASATEASQSWPFSVRIPTQADDKLFDRVDHDARFFGPEDDGAFKLPPTFSSGIGSGDEFFVEYVLTATLKDSRNTFTLAIQPITIRHSSSPTPIHDFRLTPYRLMLGNASTFHLDPFYTNSFTSIKQKAKQLFQPAPIPRLAYFLSVTYPARLQIGHPEPIPFHVTAVKRMELTSKSVREADPALVVGRVRMRIEEVGYAIAPGAFSAHIGRKRKKITLMEWKGRRPMVPNGDLGSYEATGRSSAFGEGSSEGPGPSGSSAPAYSREAKSSLRSMNRSRRSSKSSESTRSSTDYPDAPPDYEPREAQEVEPPPPDLDTLIIPWEPATLPLDLGKALDVRLVATNVGESKLRTINPSFRSASLKNSHKLKWEMEVFVAGEECYFEGEHVVEVLGPSCDDLF